MHPYSETCQLIFCFVFLFILSGIKSLHPQCLSLSIYLSIYMYVCIYIYIYIYIYMHTSIYLFFFEEAISIVKDVNKFSVLFSFFHTSNHTRVVTSIF